MEAISCTLACVSHVTFKEFAYPKIEFNVACRSFRNELDIKWQFYS